MGSPKNLKAVEKLVESGVPIDFGGGIRTLDTAKRVLDSGVDRIVIGTTAALEDRLARELLAEVGDRTIVSLASLNGYVAVRDWQARTDEKAEEFALRMKGLGARRVVFTDVSRKGMRGGANVIQLRRMALSIDIPIIASGGISSLEDVRQLKELEPLGLEGMIVVTALYSGAMRLADAIAIAEAPVE
jgi:phosphoribosylformimino-5-aminoimidazole carboxamide ribotide isomerase